MTVGTIGWLKEIVQDFPDNTKVFIAIGDKLYPLAGKIDKVILTYTTKDEPEITRGEECICLYPVVPSTGAGPAKTFNQN